MSKPIRICRAGVHAALVAAGLLVLPSQVLPLTDGQSYDSTDIGPCVGAFLMQP